MPTYKYRLADPIEKSLSMKIGENYLLQESYEATVAQITKRGVQAPILSLSEGGFLTLALDHRFFHRNDTSSFDPSTEDQVIRLVITEPKTNEEFDPILHVEPEFISTFPEKETFKMRIPSIQSIYECSSKSDLKIILLDNDKLSTNKSNIRTHTLITEKIADIIINEFKKDEPVEPLDIIFAVNQHFTTAGISRSTTGKVKVTSNNAKELMKFLLLAHHLWNQTEEDEDYIDEQDIKSLCSIVINPDAVTEPALREQMLDYKNEALKNYIAVVQEKTKTKAHDSPPPSPTSKPEEDEEVEILDPPSPEISPTEIDICKPWTLNGSCPQGNSCPLKDSHIESNPREKFLLSILRATTTSKLRKDEAERDFGSNTSTPAAPSKDDEPSLSRTDLINFKVSTVLDKLVDRLDANAGSKESTQGFHSWPDNSKTAMFYLWTKDLKRPLETPPSKIEKILKLSNGAKIALQLQSQNMDTDFHQDPAFCKNMKSGIIQMNTIVSQGKVQGLSPFSCGHDSNSITASSKLGRLNMMHDSKTMSADDISFMSSQNMFIPRGQMALLIVLENYEGMCKFWLDKSWAYLKIEALCDEIKILRRQIAELIRINGQSFCFSLLSIIHTRVALLFQRALRRPASISEASLNFDDVVNSLEEMTFMNRFASQREQTTPSGEKTGSNGKRSAPQDAPSNQQKRAKNDGKVMKNESTQIIKIVMPFRFIYAATKTLRQAGTKCVTHEGTEVCLKWFVKGSCYNNCPRKITHCLLPDDTFSKLKSYCTKIKENAPTRE